MTMAGRVLLGVLGAVLTVVVLDAAIRTFLLPRVAYVRLSQAISKAVGVVFDAIGSSKATYAQRDRILSLYPCVLLLSYQATWLALVFVAFACLFMSVGVQSAARAFELSGSSLFTLGTTGAQGAGQLCLSYVEAGIGLTLLALLIAFIPTLYAAFQRREVSVSRLTVRAGMPATPWGVIELAQSVNSYERLDELWREWESWFIEIGETHTTLTILNYYRTSIPKQTWIGSAAAVLDSAALYNSVVDQPASAAAGLCIRSGWLTLQALADYFKVSYPTQPDRMHEIAISRHEFDQVLDHLERSGVPLLADKDAAWLDFVGWRVNYDAIIEAFYVLFTCPRIDWSLSSSEPLLEPSNRRGLHRRGTTP